MCGGISFITCFLRVKPKKKACCTALAVLSIKYICSPSNWTILLLVMMSCFLLHPTRLKLLICKNSILRKFSSEGELLGRQRLVFTISTCVQTKPELGHSVKPLYSPWWLIFPCSVGPCRCLSVLSCWAEEGVLLSQGQPVETLQRRVGPFFISKQTPTASPLFSMLSHWA